PVSPLQMGTQVKPVEGIEQPAVRSDSLDDPREGESQLMERVPHEAGFEQLPCDDGGRLPSPADWAVHPRPLHGVRPFWVASAEPDQLGHIALGAIAVALDVESAVVVVDGTGGRDEDNEAASLSVPQGKVLILGDAHLFVEPAQVVKDFLVD